MATTPQPPPRPHTPPPAPPKPATPPPAPPRPEAARHTHEPHRDEPALPIGARPTDPKDPQAQKFDPPPGPPAYHRPDNPAKDRPDFTPKAAIDPRAEKPPAGFYADGMTIADEQRARSAWIEQHGEAAYIVEIDQRPDDERPVFDKNALAGGGAFVSQGGRKQVQGVTPPTRRE